MRAGKFKPVTARDAWIDAYVSVVVDLWKLRIDHEDGSSAPFTALAAEIAEPAHYPSRRAV